MLTLVGVLVLFGLALINAGIAVYAKRLNLHSDARAFFYLSLLIGTLGGVGLVAYFITR